MIGEHLFYAQTGKGTDQRSATLPDISEASRLALALGTGAFTMTLAFTLMFTSKEPSFPRQT
jgi:hypothetical protein